MTVKNPRLRQPEKPTIFISHISEEKEIAIALKKFLDNKFLKLINVFVSSHEESIKLGDDWLNNIRESMKNCKLIIVICSPISISRPWINFEAGAGWVKNTPVIPFCHSGLTPEKLPIPLNSFQGGQLNNQEDLKKLFNRVASIFQMTVPDADDKDFFNAVETFETKIKSGLLVRDTTFIYNLLYRQLELLKYSIYSSTLELDVANKIDLQAALIGDHKFTFNDTYNMFNISLLMIHGYKKIFHVYHDSVHQLVDNIKFILTYNDIKIAPKIQELLNIMLFSIVKVDDWFEQINLVDNNNSFRELSIEIIKNEPLPPTRKSSNVINSFIDHYESLLFYQSWISQYETEMNTILEQ